MPLERLKQRFNSLTLLGRLGLTAWAILLVVVGARVLLAPHRHTVYPIFAEAASHWRAGEDLYRPTPDPYRYSPLVAAFFVPFGLLPDGVGGLLWRLLSAGVFLGGLAWWARERRPLLFLLTMPLALGNVNNGQANLLVIGLLLVAVAALGEGRFALAAVCVAAATLFKMYPLAVGLLLVLAEPRRFGPRLAVALAAGLALPFVLQSPDYVLSQYSGWLHHLESNDRQILDVELWYRDLRLLCSRWLTPMSYEAYQAVELLGGLGAAAVGIALIRAGAPRPRLLTLLLALGCCWMTLLGPATESSTYVLLAPVAAWLALSREGEPRWLTWSGLGLLLLAQAATVMPWGRTFQALGPQPLGALLILGAVLIRCHREVADRRRPLSAGALVRRPLGQVADVR